MTEVSSDMLPLNLLVDSGVASNPSDSVSVLTAGDDFCAKYDCFSVSNFSR